MVGSARSSPEAVRPGAAQPRATLALVREGSVLLVKVDGGFTLGPGRPQAATVAEALAAAPVSTLRIQASGVTDWDSAFLAFVSGVSEACAARGVAVDLDGVPEGARRLLELAATAPEHGAADHVEDETTVLGEIGVWALARLSTLGGGLEFLGRTAGALVRLARGRARFRRADFVLALQQAGHEAVGIAGLISFLLGAVLAFVGAVQLQPFGAAIFVANLVGIGVVRETGALMTGIVAAGRTGASFAAVLGTMVVNEEVDALDGLGLDPIEYLVAPRVAALALMTPLVVAYADILGLLGGLLVGVTILDLGPLQYLVQTRDALSLNHVLAGLIKSVFFGAVVALSGCYHGLRCERSAESVGRAATAAVVGGILAVVISDAVFTVLFHLVGF